MLDDVGVKRDTVPRRMPGPLQVPTSSSDQPEPQREGDQRGDLSLLIRLQQGRFLKLCADK